jgi:hypothetical protein
MSEKNRELVDPGTAASFDLYQRCMDPLNSNFPQRQGLDFEEFSYSYSDPSVVSTEIAVGDKKLRLPQLLPVAAFEWLKPEYYEKHYAQECADGKLLHFSDIPDIEPGEEVKSHLAALADKSGVIVFDYPSIDSEYPERVKETLEKAGAGISDIETIGRQTYFAGQLSLKRPHTEKKRPLTFSEAFDELVAKNEFDTSEYHDGTSLQLEIKGEEAVKMYQFYSDAYDTISDHPCSQGLSPVEFQDMLIKPDVAKLVFRRNGVAETMCLITNDLDSLTWINPDYYRRKFPEKSKKEQIIWFPGIATDPNPMKAGHNFPKLANLLAHLAEVGDNSMVVVFDTPDINTGFLDAYIEEEVGKTPYADIKFQQLGVQTYCAVKLAA